MATRATPVLTGVTKPGNSAGVTEVKVVAKRKVTYVFKATSAPNLNIPYALAVNGKTLPIYAKKPARVSGSGGKIVQIVDAGSRVSLFLNSDAHPSYRRTAVYEVTAAERDVIVTITEKTGKHNDSDTPTIKTPAKGTISLAADEYTAPLTGDIWMKVSHKYEASEVDAFMPAGTGAEVVAAVKQIYQGLKSKTLTIVVPATDEKPESSIGVTFADSDNPKNNIVAYSLLADGLPRVHPGGYAALFNAAISAGVKGITMSSAWRPMLGSIAHRAGLGLDVSYIGPTQMNRQDLRNARAVHAGNVSAEEQKLFAEFEKSEAEVTKLQKVLAAAKTAAAQESATDVLAVATKRRDDAFNAWDDELKQDEPTPVHSFRKSLMKCSCVKQLFDPWYMDADTSNVPVPNMQATANEKLHAHHLHITVAESKIL